MVLEEKGIPSITFTSRNKKSPLKSDLPTHTPVPTSTSTPVPTDTPEPTMAATAIPGWAKYGAQGIEDWLPESFVGGDLENDLDVIFDNLITLGPDFEQIASTIEANPTAFVLWTFDTEIGSSGYLINMNIIRDQVLSAVSLEMYMQALAQQLPSYLTIAQLAPGQLSQFESSRLVTNTDISGVKGNELVYLIKDGNAIWVVTFATSEEEFEARLPVFEQSVQTFTTQP